MSFGKIFAIVFTVTMGAAVIMTLASTVPAVHLLLLGVVAWFGSKLFGS